MAEVFLSFVVEATLSKVISTASAQINLARGFKEELAKLRDSLSMIQAVLHDADGRQVKDKAVQLWLERLRDVAYEADNVLDDFAYEILRRKVEKQNRQKKKVRYFTFFKPVKFSFKIAKRIKKINTSLVQIKSDAAGFGLRVGNVDRVPQISQNYETDSILDSEVVGRKDDVSKVVNMLTSLGSQQPISVISIVGMAGIGKTTLAKSVCKVVEEKHIFDVMMWVCVSDNFSDQTILGGMLESLDRSAGGLCNINAIMQNLRKELEGQRFLLILDDVWNEDRGKWVRVKSRLSKINNNRNCIVVTTRSQNVALAMETFALHMHHLEKLSHDECWSIIKERAFGRRELLVNSDLEDIGREIAKRCGGLPLVANILGGTMGFKLEKEAWLSIKNSEAWKLVNNSELLPTLKLSFDNLPFSLKQCFAYCSVFPKDHEIKKDQLIQLWMAQGFLQPSEEIEESLAVMEDIGNKYFHDLLSYSLFQDVETDTYGNITTCKMHDVVHELAVSVSKSETLTLKTDCIGDFSHVRHLYVIHEEEILSQVSEAITTKKLYSLFLKFEVFHNFLGDFESLRVLKFHGSYIEELPTSLGRLRHLRYFDISWTHIKELPKSITKLYNLQTLKFVCCFCLQNLPEGMRDLVSLRHIIFNDPKLMPLEIGQLTCLLTLPLFSLGKERGNRIEELGNLSQLRGELKISHLEFIRDKAEARGAKLQEKTKIYKLEFVWGSQRDGLINDEDVLEGLQPHSNLKSLTIAGYAGENFPSWILTTAYDLGGNSLLLSNLVNLNLINCRKSKSIPTIGQLCNLKVLTIGGMENVKYIGNEFYYNSSMRGTKKALVLFPALRKFTLKEMSNLNEWVEDVEAAVNGTDQVLVFPRLEELIIWSCPKLKIVPIKSGYSSLQKLDIRWCAQLSFVGDGLSASTCLKNLSIWECPNLMYIPDTSMLFSLREVEISGCAALSSLPTSLSLCISLEVLRISNCPSLISLPEDIGRLQHLHSLGITFCGKLTAIPDSISHLTQLKVLRIGGLSEELEEFPGFDSIQCLHVSLEDFRLYGWEKLKALPYQLQHLTALKSLDIRNFSEVETVPQWLGNLTSLQELVFWRCKNLTHLPPLEAMQCLSRLQTLRLHDCPRLKDRCLEESDHEWSKISHIPSIKIDNASVQEIEVVNPI